MADWGMEVGVIEDLNLRHSKDVTQTNAEAA